MKAADFKTAAPTLDKAGVRVTTIKTRVDTIPELPEKEPYAEPTNKQCLEVFDTLFIHGGLSRVGGMRGMANKYGWDIQVTKTVVQELRKVVSVIKAESAPNGI